MVEVGSAQVKALPAEERQAGRVAGDGEGKRLALRVRPHPMVPGMINGQLIGNGPQRGQQPTPPDNDPGIRLAHDRQRHVLT